MKMKKTAVSKYLAEIGKKGGEKSKRKLTPEQARDMVKAREKKKKAKDPKDAALSANRHGGTHQKSLIKGDNHEYL